MTEWVLLIAMIIVGPVPEAGPDSLGQVLHVNLFGSMADQATCSAAGEHLSAQFERVSGGNVDAVFVCSEMDADLVQDIARDQGWTRINPGEPL
ncbi:MAG: hypothetical protein AAF252_11650 [Pseudomonadota bacterium]